MFVEGPGGRLLSQGMLYFFLDFFNKESSFIGAYINPSYRNKGLASLLVANWIKVCYDNDIVQLRTNKKQKKPLLIYLLKCCSFEIKKPEDYDISSDTISIYRGADGAYRLWFKNPIKKAAFIQSTVCNDGDYKILDTLEEGIILVDRVLLARTYFPKDSSLAYSIAEEKIATKERVALK